MHGKASIYRPAPSLNRSHAVTLEDDYVDEYDSGPFCRHWSDPADCKELCGRCGHGCIEHAYDDGDRSCNVEGCPCKEWSDGPPSGIDSA